jgi:hypothetical protein
MEPTVEIALIAAVPPTVIGLVTLVLGILTRSKLNVVEKNTNNMLSRLTDERNTASTRADTAEAHAQGRIEGVAAQQAEKGQKP